MHKRIVLTGGGTAGHVTPNIALMEHLAKEDWEINYMGSEHGVERAMIETLSIPYYAVRSGKLRRYFSWRTLLEPFYVIWGIFQAYRILRRLKPCLVFSKGGFVAFPVVFAAWLCRIPVIAHESDLSPGLANRLSFPFVDTICVNFPAAKQHFKHQDKVELTGTPLRSFLFSGDKARAKQQCGFQEDKPCLLVIGGSLGAQAINICVRKALDTLCCDFNIIHVCGKGKLDPSYKDHPGYYQLEYAQEELADFFALSDVVLSRAGANSVSEIIALAKPHVFIPLSKQVSRGDQVQNAAYFEQQGISIVLNEEELSPKTLCSALKKATNEAKVRIQKMQVLQFQSASAHIIKIFGSVLHDRASSH